MSWFLFLHQGASTTKDMRWELLGTHKKPRSNETDEMRANKQKEGSFLPKKPIQYAA
jgi:hypothetical protein